MPVSQTFLDFVRDGLAGLGDASLKRMFGGAGVLHRGRMIGIVAGDTLYFRVGPASEAQYRAAGSGPFVYQTKKGPKTMAAYWRVPAAALDEPDELVRLARAALADLGPAAPKPKPKPAAKRKAKAKPRKPASKRRRR